MGSSTLRVISPCPSAIRSELRFIRLVHPLLAAVLAVFALLAGIKQYFGNPISCAFPPDFTFENTEYLESRCYFSAVYYRYPNLTGRPDLESPQTNVYKWTPFFLLFFSILYLLPELFFRAVCNVFTFNLDNILALSRRCETAANENERDSAVKTLTTDLQRLLRDRSSKSRKPIFSLPLIVKLQYIGSKLFFLIGSIIPIIVIFSNLRPNLNLAEQLSTVKSNLNIDTAFPDNVLCQMHIVNLQNIWRYTLSCHLPANDMFEKMILLAGIFSLVTLSLTACDFVAFLIRCVTSTKKNFFIDEELHTVSQGNNGEIDREFTQRYLGEDGIYLLALIEENSSESVVSRILQILSEHEKI